MERKTTRERRMMELLSLAQLALAARLARLGLRLADSALERLERA